MKIDFEYGHGVMTAELPDNTDIFIPGETVKDPDYIPEDKLEEAYLESLAHPIGMPTLTELAHKGSKVVIVIPDIVKGGCQPTSHRKVSITCCLDELYSVGVEKKDILLLISLPKFFSISSIVVTVSSTVSCKYPAATTLSS